MTYPDLDSTWLALIPSFHMFFLSSSEQMPLFYITAGHDYFFHVVSYSPLVIKQTHESIRAQSEAHAASFNKLQINTTKSIPQTVESLITSTSTERQNERRQEPQCAMSAPNLTCVFISVDLNWMQSEEERCVPIGMCSEQDWRVSLSRQNLSNSRRLKLTVIQSKRKPHLRKQSPYSEHNSDSSLTPFFSLYTSVQFSLFISSSSRV